MLLLGDSAKVLRAVKDSAVDLVLTDPPYGLSFMGKAWDRSTPEAVIFAECYRILKPGAFILVMASPRNDDLVSIALREAGFIKHNSIYWVYGSGFPKGTDVSKQIDAQAVREWLDGKDHGLTAAEVRKVISAAVNGEAMPETYRKSQGKNDPKARPHPITPEERKVGAELIESLESRFGPMPKRVKVGEYESPENTTGFKGQDKRNIYGEPNHKDGEPRNLTAPATPLAQEWKGFKYGIQALKPAAEVILVFQKPFDGKPLDSIIKWGVGAVDVDGGRIATANWDAKKMERCNTKGSARFKSGKFTSDGSDVLNTTQGRYPSNFITSHAPGCRVAGERRVRGNKQGTKPEGTRKRRSDFALTESNIDYTDADGREAVKDWTCVDGCPVKLLDAQSGESKSSGGRIGNKNGGIAVPGGKYEKGDPGFGDTGTASRFFYQPEWSNADPFIYEAKASTRERNAGTENGSSHPTVKPVELFHYLIKLFRGKGQVILDPFVGSGTTCVAAVLEGVKCIGIDAEPEYIQIAQAREKHWAKYRSEYLTTGQIPVVKEAELPLFKEAL